MIRGEIPESSAESVRCSLLTPGVCAPVIPTSPNAKAQILSTSFASGTGCLCGWDLVIEGGDIPQFHGFVVAAGGEVFAVG